MNQGFPELTDSFLAGQDILYSQFNEIEFYVEDEDQEHFYFNVLKNLFPALKFQKIFPLNGKKNVIFEANSNVGNKKKIYIVDLDFDHILGTVKNIENLFYLKKYSIENHLFSKSAIYETIRNKNPKLKDIEIDVHFNFNELLKTAACCLKELALTFVVIQKHNLNLCYYGLNVSRDFNFTTSTPTYRMNFIKDYLNKVDQELKNKDKRLSLKGQICKFKNYFNNFSDSLSYIPGKYILTFVKERLQALNLINQITIESYKYALSKDFKSNELDYLKSNITKYIK